MDILMCRPAFFDIEYEINPWMNKAIKADHLKAANQWKHLHDTIVKCGQNCDADVVLVEPESGLPDMVFTANAGLVKNKQVLLSDFRHPERQGEKHFFKQWFVKQGYDVLDTDPKTAGMYFEGEGDALFAGNYLFAGYGMRSEKGYYENISRLTDCELIYCELTEPYFYHLDTCFCPLDGKVGIWRPDSFTKESQQAMQSAMELIAIPEAEARHFACNAVVLGKQVIIPADCPETTAILEDLGYTVYSCEVTEFIKSGGACKCLTLFI